MCFNKNEFDSYRSNLIECNPIQLCLINQKSIETQFKITLNHVQTHEHAIIRNTLLQSSAEKPGQLPVNQDAGPNTYSWARTQP